MKGLPKFGVAALLASAAHLALAGVAEAWNHTGHRVSARIAWQDLTPSARTAASKLLKAHPRYEQDLLRGMPAGHGEPERWAFMSAAYWPDIIRDRANPMHATHHRGPWHYVNYAYASDGDRRGYQDGTADRPPGGEPQNVLQAIDKVRADVFDPAVPEAGRAVALCWYLHLVGDLHQPLHSTSLVNADFPQGDRGGNGVLVRHGEVVIDLHAFWDNRLGVDQEPAALERIAERVVGDGPRDGFADDALPATAERVAVESRALAVPYAYLHGHLRYVAAGPDSRPPAAAVPPLPPGYEEASAAIGRRRVAQAGYRMGEELNRGLDPSHQPRTAPATRPATRPTPRPGTELLVDPVPPR